MTKKPYPSDTLAQAISVQEAWGRIDEGLAFGNLNISGLVTDINQIRQTEHILADLENQLTDMRNRRDALYQSTWDKVKRVRSSIKGIFGDDSSQYEMVGGTRLSERKTPTRRTVTSA